MIRKKRALRGCLTPAVLLFALILLLWVLCALSCGQTAVEISEAHGVPVRTLYIKEGDPARPGIARKIKYIVLHETGNSAEGADAKRHAMYLRYNNEEDTSWHYTVDETEIYHHIPDGEVAWHASDRLKNPGGNRNGIGIELCVNRDGDFEATFDNAARLVAVLLDAYGLDSSAIRQHADFTNKNCPETIRDTGRMEEFRELVEQYREN